MSPSPRPQKLSQLLLMVLLATNMATAMTTAAMCAEIEAQIPGRTFYFGDAAFNNSQSAYYSMQERELEPGCVFTPTSTAEVARFVQLIAATGDGAPQFAVRSGGHKYFAGAANIDGGITVDMRQIDQVSLSADQSVAQIGGGAIWSEDVYPYLAPYNRTAAGGRLPGIGVGGFLTGGGLSFQARKHGWSCDSIVGYEVVLGTGKVVNATATSNPDLWLALKGGGNNFGIVTRFDMTAYLQGDMLGGVVGYPYTLDVLNAQAEAFSDFMKPENFDPAAMMGVLITYQYGSRAVANSLFYLDPIPRPAVYEPFLSMPDQVTNNLVIANTRDIVEAFGSFTPANLQRAAEINYSFKNSGAAAYSELFRIYNDSLVGLEQHNISGAGIQWLTQPQAVTNGINSFGLVPNKTDVVMVDIVLIWNDAADDVYMNSYLDSLLAQHVQALTRRGLYIPFVYLNYAGQSQDPIGSYGQNGDIKNHLQAVSSKYDPKKIFQTKVPGGFKLFP